MPNALYHNRGDGTFEDVSVPSGIASHIGKAMSVSFADFNNDGKIDVVDGIGARIRIGTQYNHMTTNVGYASSSHFGVHFGLGKAQLAERIEIRWPSGMEQVLASVPVNQVLRVREPEK